MNNFHEVTARLEQALEGIAYDKLDISDEVKEQVIHIIFERIFRTATHSTCIYAINRPNFRRSATSFF